MRVLENLLNLTGDMVPNYRPANATASPIERKTVGDELWIRAISPASWLRTYLRQSVVAPFPEIITHSVEVNPEIDCSIFDYRDQSQISFCPAGVWTRLFVTFNAPTVGNGYYVNCSDPDIVGKWIRTRNPISVAGDQEPDIWTPPHTALTPEQIALMKYGEYKEIKSF